MRLCELQMRVLKRTPRHAAYSMRMRVCVKMARPLSMDHAGEVYLCCCVERGDVDVLATSHLRTKVTKRCILSGARAVRISACGMARLDVHGDTKSHALCNEICSQR